MAAVSFTAGRGDTLRDPMLTKATSQGAGSLAGPTCVHQHDICALDQRLSDALTLARLTHGNFGGLSAQPLVDRATVGHAPKRSRTLPPSGHTPAMCSQRPAALSMLMETS